MIPVKNDKTEANSALDGAVEWIGSGQSDGQVITVATNAAERAAGPIATCFEVPNIVYVNRQRIDEYNPQYAGKPANSEYASACGISINPIVIPDITSRKIYDNYKMFYKKTRISLKTLYFVIQVKIGISLSGW